MGGGGKRTGGVKPGEGYEYRLDMTTGRWVCEKISKKKNITMILMRSQEEAGFTTYDASDVEDVGRFRPEDGVPMWRTFDEKALEPGWHWWSYNSNRDLNRTWALWSETERYFETTITGWKDVIRRPGIIPPGGIYTRPSTHRSGDGTTMKRSGGSGGGGAGKKGRKYWSWPTGTSGSWKKTRGVNLSWERGYDRRGVNRSWK